MSIQGFSKPINSAHTETRAGHIEMRQSYSEYNVYLPILLWSTTIITFIRKTCDIFLLLPVSLHIKVHIIRNFFMQGSLPEGVCIIT